MFRETDIDLLLENMRLDVVLEEKLKEEKLIAEQRNKDTYNLTEILQDTYKEYDEYGNNNALEEYVKYRRKVLFKMLNVFFGNSKKELHEKDNRVYTFNSENYEFIYKLVNLYDNKNVNCRLLAKGQYADLEEDFLVFYYNGLKGLVENERLEISRTDFIEKWNRLFNPHYKEICSIAEDLRSNIVYYLATIPANGENKGLYKWIKRELIRINNEIIRVAEERMKFPDLDFKELEDDKKKLQKVKSEKSQRAKKQWEKKKECEKEGEEKKECK